MPTKVQQPLILRDFSRGRIISDAVAESLVPVNSVDQSTNFNYDTKIGSAVVRPGSLIVGTSPTANSPLGLSEFVRKQTTALNDVVASFAGATNAGVYVWNGTTWSSSVLTLTGNPTRVRFAVLNGSIFLADGVDAMTSSVDTVTWNTTNTVNLGSVRPALVFRSKQHLLASGYSARPDRVYFSTLVDPSQTAFIDWYVSDTAPTTGTAGWIDINPDDNSTITGFAETSNTTLVFKSQGLYRLDVINQNVESQNIWNIGAVSQEAIVNCQGIVYFFSGYNICQTAGDIPQEISRLGVSDYLSAIPQQNWSKVAAGTDGLNVYFSIGNITLNTNEDNQKTYTNVVLKFSPRDQAWSVHSYPEQPLFFCQYTPTVVPAPRQLIGACSSGNTNTYNVGTTDNGSPINYELILQDQEFSDRGHLNKISDKIVVFGQGLNDSQLQVRPDDDGSNYKDIQIDLSKRVNIGQAINLQGYFFSFRIFGNSSGTSPIFEGIEIEEVSDMGITKK
jgi:hypothetical protein